MWELLYSGFILQEKTFTNCLKIDFDGENLCGFAVTQFTTLMWPHLVVKFESEISTRDDE